MADASRVSEERVADEPPDGRERRPPPWAWGHLAAEERSERWKALALWVGWLEESHSPWIALPPCWALHEGLREELKVFWYWHQWSVGRAANPVDAVRWHQELRRSAEAWRQLSTCAHESPLPQHQMIVAHRQQQASRYVAEAVEREVGSK